VSFAATTLCVASQRVFVVHFVIDLIRKLLDALSYVFQVVSSIHVSDRNSLCISHLSNACYIPAQLILLDVINVITSGEVYKL